LHATTEPHRPLAIEAASRRGAEMGEMLGRD